MTKLIPLFLLFSAPVAAYADPSDTIPEPETLSLLAIGAVALMLSKVRRKK